MSKLTWDAIGSRHYETGVDHGVLYLPNTVGVYDDGVAWNGLVSVTESPAGAEPTAMYADNIKYLNLYSVEWFMASIEAFTYPDEFAEFDGLAVATPGVLVGQQSRRSFGLSYRTKLGNDLVGDDRGYKLHLVYGATASPSEKAYSTINESPEVITFSWELSTSPVAVTGHKPTANLIIDSTKVNAAALANLENIIYGTVGVEPRLPLPDEVIAMFAGTIITVEPTEPAYNDATDTITIPTVVGVTYYINDVAVPAGPRVIFTDTVVQARPNQGYQFPAVVDDDWFYNYNPA